MPFTANLRTEKTKTIEIELDVPNFDIAVERACARAVDDLEPEESIKGVLFVRLAIELRRQFGRNDRFVYNFEIRYN
jgi:hypothetical protein